MTQATMSGRPPERVLAIVTEAFGGRGGIAAVTRDTMRALASLEGVASIRCHAMSVRDDAVSGLSAVYDQRGPTGRAGLIAAALSDALLLRPTIVYANHVHFAPVAAFAARLAMARLAVHVHGVEVWTPLCPLRRWALERADLVIAVSRDTRRRILEQTTLPQERVRVVNNGVGDAFEPQDRTAARAALRIEGGPVLSTVGRLSAAERYKGHDLTLDALPGLLSRSPEAIYLIAGEGNDRPRLEDKVEKMGLAAHVRFLGHIPDSQLPALYAATDLYVMPSAGEGFGIAFVEAMACGAPALGLAEGGAPDAFRDGVLGHLTDRATFPQALTTVLAGAPPDRRSLARLVRETFGFAAFEANLHRAFGALLGCTG